MLRASQNFFYAVNSEIPYDWIISKKGQRFIRNKYIRASRDGSFSKHHYSHNDSHYIKVSDMRDVFIWYSAQIRK